MPLSRLHRTGGELRYRSCDPLSARGHASVESGVSVPKTPPAQNVLDRRLGTAPATRWCGVVDLADRTHLHDPSWETSIFSGLGHPHLAAATPTATADVQHRPGSDDAPTPTHPRPRTRRTHQSRTRTEQPRPATVLAEPGADVPHRLFDIGCRTCEGQPHERSAAHRVEVDAGCNGNTCLGQQLRAERQ